MRHRTWLRVQHGFAMAWLAAAFYWVWGIEPVALRRCWRCGEWDGYVLRVLQKGNGSC
jgi:hypothetical protein